MTLIMTEAFSYQFAADSSRREFSIVSYSFLIRQLIAERWQLFAGTSFITQGSNRLEFGGLIGRVDRCCKTNQNG